MYSQKLNLTLGFHGCEKDIANKVLNLELCLNPSVNEYDWLGHGIYFWENDAERAMQFAKEKGLKNPAVIGAVIDLGTCMDLRCQNSIKPLKDAYEIISMAGTITENSCNKNGYYMKRDLDCLVIEAVHNIRKGSGYPPYDSVIGTFEEGDLVYPGAGFHEKTHTQICVRSPNCILGYFLPK